MNSHQLTISTATAEPPDKETAESNSPSENKKKKGHHKGRYSLSLFSSHSSTTNSNNNNNNNNHIINNNNNNSPFAIPTASTSTPTLLIGPPTSPGYASLSPSTLQNSAAPHDSSSSVRHAARHQSLSTAAPSAFLTRYLSPANHSLNNNNSNSPAQNHSPVPGPSARPDWAHSSTSNSTASTASSSHRALARSYTLAPEPLVSASSPHNHRFATSNTPTIRAGPSLPPPRNTLESRPNQGPASGQERPPNGATATSQLEAKVVILGMQGLFFLFLFELELARSFFILHAKKHTHIGVGKTSIVHRYTTGSFSYSLTSTIGASFCTKKLSVDGCKVRLQIWDTAGQERFRSMAPMYYRGANAAILVYDITNMESFFDIQNWLDGSGKQGRPRGGSARGGPRRGAESACGVDGGRGAAGGRTDGVESQRGPAGRRGLVFKHGAGLDACGNQRGIEELFLILSRRLVLRKAQIDRLRMQRSRDSVHVHHSHGSSNPNHRSPLSSSSDNHNPSSSSQSSGFCC
ncbi:hypothetical protein VP01_2823g4 [Puccinia sorghi]|uniref:Uncharacterized protein n=1 Tax=Puccinia sorghi TaxID=27349 RepID=A0A0L6V2A4_9BASI|nr:hypothetical protein VP01_2823g4 [Puccinia sorghi]